LKKIIRKIILSGLLVVSTSLAFTQKNKGSIWLTDPARSVLFVEQPESPVFIKKINNGPVITIDDQKTYQEIDGFGFALTGGSATHIKNMGAQARAALLKELFATDGTNIGTSYLLLQDKRIQACCILILVPIGRMSFLY